MTRILVVLAIFLLTIQINGYPNGAPKKVCIGSMIPHHHHLAPQPPETSPITNFNTAWNPDSETISIQIESNQPMKGVFIQGRRINGNEPLGTFVNIPSETHLVHCSTGDGITHSSPQKWTQLQLTWKKPTSITSQEEIQFWATIVVDFENFWVVKSVPTELKHQQRVMTFMDTMKNMKKMAFQMMKWTKIDLFQYD
ncbi:unnamed protein product [Rotaria sordida]|uniref:Reelin domain-containing protein n=1 Tax=Rotaria sordida TaxID=392033 RepID=A0A813TDI9_9BILA|nr:unnamed protein product [Rotaria sordida]CAF0810072.1 unnamed protein product [Rotaria sordida]CAF0812691.1 unnamed protein product [Rotaria sordida]CAF0830614.1 unnamed protein product [Rotaria sordida]CAF0837966.1 unnamed protein product [Rotaria sordida]